MGSMTRRGIAAGVWALLAGSSGAADKISEADAARVQSGIIIHVFDVLSARCAQDKGFSSAQRTEISTWRSENGVDKLRDHLNGKGLTSDLREQIKAAGSSVIDQTAAKAPPCDAAVALTRMAPAKFGGKLPLLMAGATDLAAATKPSGAPLEVTLPAPRAASTTPAASAAKYAGDIEGFAFDSCTRIGYGGMVMFTPCPVVLFKNGEALTDVEGLSEPKGLAAHRAASPKKWTQWRRAGGKVELVKKDGWKAITYTALYSTLPKGFTLEGRYQSMSGSGNTALGGGDAAMAWSDYRFSRDGRVQRGGGAGSSSTGSGVDVTTSSRAQGRSGRYRVEGLVLVIDFDDGSSERRIIVADPKDEGRGTMWLDGTAYTFEK